MESITSLIPLIIFLCAALGIALYARNIYGKRQAASQQKSSFIADYFIGGYGLGPVALALTTVATYGSVSSFVGGPGQAWNIGWGWVYMSAVQVTSLLLLYGILGKKIALVGRKIKAVTLVDILRSRYESKALAYVSALIIVIFFVAMMVAQFVGGAKLFEAVTGYSYIQALILFGIVSIIFTSVGGFRGVAFTDVLCGIVMLVGIVIFAGGLLYASGGLEAIGRHIAEARPQLNDPFSEGKMPIGLYVTQWLLVGLFTFGLPQNAIRTLASRDSQSFHRGLILGTAVLGFMMISVTSLGVLSVVVLPGDLAEYGGNVDSIIPLALVKALPGQIAAIAIVGPIAASISTVSSLLITGSSSLIKDMYMDIRTKRISKTANTYQDQSITNDNETEKDTLRSMSIICTLSIGAIVFVLALVPPDVIWKINMFAFGGLETAFCWVLLGGLFWKRANKTGALLGMIGGVLAYCITMACGITFFGLHQIVIGLLVSGVFMIVGSLLGKPSSQTATKIFFP